MVWNREEYIAHMTFQYTGKEMLCELFGPLVGLEAEWIKQGATKGELDLSAFGFDSAKNLFIGANTAAVTGISTVTLEDNAEYTIFLDEMGRKQKLIKSSATLGIPLDYPVKNFDDWLKIKHWYEFDEKRIDKEKLEKQKKLQAEGYLTIATIPGGFDETRQLLGEEELCVAYYEQPELIEDVLNTIGDTSLRVFERVTNILTIDNLFVHEDMAGKSGPLAGPIQVDEFIKPYYRKVWNELSLHGTRLFSQDSDGNMNAVIDNFLDAGINNMHPFEPAAGMDMVATRQKYGKRLAIKGGIDKHVLRKDKEAIRKELEYKINAATKCGGTVFGLDHRIPNGVSLENYKFYVDYSRELLGLPARSNEEFVRMAF